MSPEALAQVFPLLLIVLAFWFLVIRPARKRQQTMSKIQNSVDIGTEVMLGSGLYGHVVSVADDTLQLELAPGTVVKVARQAIVRVIEPVHDLGPSHETGETPGRPSGEGDVSEPGPASPSTKPVDEQ